jgi:hypothetical protein
VDANPKRLNQMTGLSIYGAEIGKRPGDVGESTLDGIGVLVWTLRERHQSTAGPLVNGASDQVSNQGTRHRRAAGERSAHTHALKKPSKPQT